MFHPAIFCCSLDKGFPAPTETAGLKFLSQKSHSLQLPEFS